MRDSTVTENRGNAVAAFELARGRRLVLSRPLLMGVLNVTPDSFSDGGHHITASDAVRRAMEMAGQGADIIDVGGESSRPGAEPVSAEVEAQRVLPVIEEIRRRSDMPISIDTYHAATARAALDAGADMVNDISALRFDPEMARLIAERRVPVILMHMLGTPRSMQQNPSYDNCVEEIAEFFRERIAFCEQSGISRTSIILDPGIGFGKRVKDNLEILARLRYFRQFALPLLVGASRKSFIGKVHPAETLPENRLGGSIAAAVTAVRNGADMIRVHDVGQTAEAVRVTQAIRDNQ
jgi:dihydropteroate synthase